MADRIVVMQAGLVEQIGTPLELYDAPANVFVAAFIGSPSMNLYPGTIETSEAGLSLRMDLGAILPLPAHCSAVAGDKVVVGIRPEDIVIGDGPGVVARISTVEPTGSETLLLCKVGAASTVVVSRERVMVGPGDEIALVFPSERLHLFDQTSGHRL